MACDLMARTKTVPSGTGPHRWVLFSEWEATHPGEPLPDTLMGGIQQMPLFVRDEVA